MKLQLALVALVAVGSTAHAQQQPPIRQLGSVFATAQETPAIVGHMRALPGGRVLVNDPIGRRVVMLDSALRVVKVVADSTSGTANAYGARPGGLIAFRGDSTLFVDPASLSMLVIDPEGRIARVMSVPRPEEAAALTSISFGSPGFDQQGWIVYRAMPQLRRVMQSAAGSGERSPAMPEMPDTAAIVRLDLATRAIDTVAWVKIPRVSMNVTRGDDGTFTMSQVINPLPVVDEWVVTSDGVVTLVRGRDYRVERVGPDGQVVSSSRLPFDWQRLTDEDKVALIDSVKAQRARMEASGDGAPRAGGTVVFGGPQGSSPPPGGTVNITMRAGPGGAPTSVNSGNMRTNISFVAPTDLPDYKPPFLAGAARADADGNVWVRTIPTRAIPGGAIYDVISPKGELVERVQVPAGREIRGFGPGGLVYLVGREENRTVLEVARAR